MTLWPQQPTVFAWRTQRFGIVTLGAFAADEKAAELTARICVSLALSRVIHGR